MNNIKARLHQLCVAYVKNRIKAAEMAIAEAQQSQINDTKSSAGDKYETGREMMQQETNRFLSQLNEANKLMVALNHTPFNTIAYKAETGSVVITDNGNFYLSVSAGSLILNDETYLAVSLASPIGIKLKDKKAGDSFTLNQKNYQIDSIF